MPTKGLKLRKEYLHIWSNIHCIMFLITIVKGITGLSHTDRKDLYPYTAGKYFVVVKFNIHAKISDFIS